jgi:replication factor C small subunit
MINASMNGGIDTLRNEITNFASSVSFSGGKKYVILDEADHLTAAAQAAFRGFLEEFSTNCGFIFTCNYPKRIIEPLHSRTTLIDMKFSKNELQDMAAQFMKRCSYILDSENVEYDKKVVAEVIMKYLPDWRKVINDLQRYASATGNIDSGILANLKETSINELMKYLKNKEFTNMRKWVSDNADAGQEIYRQIYDNVLTYLDKSSVPSAIIILGKYGYQHMNCADIEVNLAACCTELMMEDFK